MLALPIPRLVREAVPVAVILLVWNVLAAVTGHQAVSGEIRNAGALMAGLYVVVRGVGLAEVASPPETTDLRAVLAENVRVAIPAGVWFLGAILVFALDGYAFEYSPSTWATILGGSLAGAGLGVVGLYAIATGTAAIRGEESGSANGTDAGTTVGADD